MTDHESRHSLIDSVLRLTSEGLNKGTSGNVSLRTPSGYLITPSGVDYDTLQAEDLVAMDFKDKPTGRFNPSSEWRFHRDIYTHRGNAMAIVHCHSFYATTLSTLRREIPSFHYMVAIAGGNSIRCADYATFGTQDLSDNILAALVDRKACLMSNHGLLTYGKNLRDALKTAIEVENLAGQYIHALQLGKPVLLDDEEMAVVIEKFKSYGNEQ
jgi:L-fuculose-phosphate aldolase